MKWNLDKFANKDVIFIGKGREGKSFEAFINKYGEHRSFTFIDQADDPNYLDALTKVDQKQTIVVKTAGCPGRIVPVPYTTPTNVFFELAQQAGYTLIGITGTKGKSTTSSLIHHMLSENGIESILCGNIGKPMIDFLDTPNKNTVFVLELGAYMTADLTLSPHIAVIGNLYREHIDYFGDEATYYEAKHKLIAHQQKDDYFVYNPDFSLLKAWAEHAPSIKVPIIPSHTSDIVLENTAIIGEHNKINILLAVEVAKLFNISQQDALKTLVNFKPLPHRLEKVATINNVTYIDDAISTTPESTLAALAAIPKIGCLMLGGLDRGYDFTQLASEVARLNIPNIVLFPDSGKTIAALFPDSYKPKIVYATSMQEAVQFAALHAPSGSNVLLSCASPSYTLWKDFEAKGDDFKQQVAALHQT